MAEPVDTPPRVRRPARARPLRGALALLALAAGGLAGVEVALFAAGPATPRWLFYLFALVGFEYVAAGLLAWSRRPGNGTGALLCLCGLSLLAAAMGNTTAPALIVAGNVVAELPIGVLLHLLLAFPSGRLPDVRSRRLVIAGYAVTVVLQVPEFLISGDPALPAVLNAGTHPDAALVMHRVQDIAGALVIALTAWVLVQRLRAADRRRRAILAAVYGYGTFTIVFLVLSADILTRLLHLDPVQLFELQILAVAGVPIAFVAGVLRGGFARTKQLEELAEELGSVDSGAHGLRDALRATLGDPSIELLFWLPEQTRYVDDDGHPAVLPAADSGRAAVTVHTLTGHVGAISYDATLLADPGQVSAAGRIVAVALERQRLTAQLRASQAQLLQSRARIVQSGDQERRRIARDLHDGLQGRLVVLALAAGRLATDTDSDRTRDQARQLRLGLENAITELRRLVHGVLPALLLQRGLPATIEELLDATPLRSRLIAPDLQQRLPPHVETVGYFVVAEALANTVKHAHAHQVQVTLTHTNGALHIEVCDDGVGGVSPGGSGLHGLSDRVEALGGQVHVESTPGHGTRLRAELPCAS